MAAFGVVVLLALITVTFSTLTPTENFPHSLPLMQSDVYHLFWKYDEIYITFEVHVKTDGYVGFGLSLTGGMEESDIVIGWVKDGKAYLRDCYADRKAVPKKDESQDWELLEGYETENYTVLKFRRKFKTCDDRDVEISDDTTRIIWAYKDGREPDTPEQDPPYHGVTTRGSKTMYLLTPLSKVAQLPENKDSIDFLNRDYRVPNSTTTYYCQAFSVPKLATKHHIVMIEPIIQPGNEATVHHMILYACYHDLDTEEHPQYTKWDDLHGLGGVCYEENMPTDSCSHAIISWAIGGGPIYFPEHLAYPIGGQDEKMLFLRLETHYDNPGEANDIVDASGLRIWITTTLREHEMGVLAVGMEVSPEHVIPPGYQSLTNIGFCPSSCRKNLGDEDKEVKMVAAILHTHLAGHALRLRLFRSGVEQDIVMRDEKYDFNFQDFRFLTKEISVKSKAGSFCGRKDFWVGPFSLFCLLRVQHLGKTWTQEDLDYTDDIVLECAYKTSERTKPTWGGLSTQDEMCLAYVYYYPRSELHGCASIPTREQTLSYLEEDNKDVTWEDYIDKIKDQEWNNNLRNKFQEAVTTGEITAHCSYETLPDSDTPMKLPEYVKLLPPPDGLTCGATGLSLFWAKYVTLLLLWLYVFHK